MGRHWGKDLAGLAGVTWVLFDPGVMPNAPTARYSRGLHTAIHVSMTWLSAYRRLWGLLLRRRGLLGTALIGMAGAAAATGLFALLTGPALKLLFTGGSAPVWLAGALGSFLRQQSPARLRLILPLILLAVAAVRAAFGYLQASRMAQLCLRTVAELQESLHRKLLELPLSFFEGHHSGEVYARFSTDLGHVERALTQGMTYGLRDAFQLVALVWVSLWLDARLLLLGCLTMPIAVFVIARFARALRSVSVRLQAQQAALLSQTQDLLSGALVLQVYGAEASALRAQARAEDGLLRDGARSAALRAAVTPTVEFLALAGLALVLVGLSVRFGGGRELPPEKVVSFFGAVMLAYQPLKSISSNSQWLVPGLIAAERLFHLLDTPLAIADAPSARALPRRVPAVPLAFEGVTVRYGARAALDAVDLRLLPGQRVAVVGSSGAGKSTLLHLVPRLLDPTSGLVRFAGEPVRELQLSSLRAQIGLVGQDVFLFDATVEENLSLGEPRPRADLLRALAAAGALEFVEALPAGLGTRLGERGHALSGGQRQRLSLSRALLKAAPLLLLDEAMSALDPPLEAQILRNLLHLSRPQTLLLVTHRLPSAALLDRVVVLEDGRIAEDGTPVQLLRAGGWFARAHAAQASPAIPANSEVSP